MEQDIDASSNTARAGTAKKESNLICAKAELWRLSQQSRLRMNLTQNRTSYLKSVWPNTKSEHAKSKEEQSYFINILKTFF